MIDIERTNQAIESIVANQRTQNVILAICALLLLLALLPLRRK